MAGVVDEAYGDSIREFEAYEVKIRTEDDLIREVNEYMDCDDEFGKQLVDHFPMEDGMPAFSDVRDFMQNWSDRDYDDNAVDFMCMMMEFVYPFVLSAEEHRHADKALAE